jgi:hypothetical protein
MAPDPARADGLIELTRRLIAAAQAAGAPAKALGGLGVRLRVPDPHPALARPFADVDIATARRSRRAVEEAFANAGLQPEREFNALQGSRRQIWWTPDGATHVDVFLGEFAMCHSLDLDDRLSGEHPALPAADLLLTKLQVVHLTLKDVQDVAGLLAAHELDEDDRTGTLGFARLREVLTADWGFFTTVTDNLERLPELVADIAPEVVGVVGGRAARIRDALEEAPKTRAFRLRARVGRRRRWYELPEETLPA